MNLPTTHKAETAVCLSSAPVSDSVTSQHRGSLFQGLLNRIDSLSALLLRFYDRFWGQVFGLLGLVFLMAVVSTIPILQLAVLGFLIVSSGQVFRTGRFSAGRIGLGKGRRILSLFLGSYIVILPLKWVIFSYRSSLLINGPGPETNLWVPWGMVLGLLTSLHLFGAILAGGRLFAFLWPVFLPFTIAKFTIRLFLRKLGLLTRFQQLSVSYLPQTTSQYLRMVPDHDRHPLSVLWERIKNGRVISEPAKEFWRLIPECRVGLLLWTGFQFVAGTVVWFSCPVLLLTLSLHVDGFGAATAIYVFGIICLAACVNYFPFTCLCFAKTRDWKSFWFGWSSSKIFSASPFRLTLVMFVCLLFSVPVMLFRIEMIPFGLWWILAIPAFVMSWIVWGLWGWAGFHCFEQNQETENRFQVASVSTLSYRKPSRFLWRSFWRLVFLSLVVVQTILLIMSLYLSWEGNLTLLRPPLFEVPTPFFFETFR